jgi:peroxiredoxin Q/BCP
MAKKKKDEEFPGYIKNKANKGSVSLGKKVPNFKAATTADAPFDLKDFEGKKLVIYFYPKDHTSGCTTEGLDFTKNIKKFKSANTEVVGISRESLDSHQKFIEKQSYKFDLLSDPDEVVCKLFDVIKEKSMYGKKYMGIERSTFLIDEDGKLAHEWRNVKVPGHVIEVLEKAKEI